MPESGSSSWHELTFVDRALTLAAGFVVYLLPIGTLLPTHLDRHPLAVGVLLAAGVIGFALGRERLRTFHRWLPAAIGTVYYTCAALYLLLVMLLATLGSLTTPVIVLLWSGALFGFSRFGQRRLFFVLHTVVSLVLLLYLHKHIMSWEPTFVPFVLLGLIALNLLLVWRRRALEHFAAAALFFYVLASLLFAISVIRYQGMPLDRARGIGEQRGVRLLHAYEPQSQSAKALGNDHMFAARLADGLVLGPRKRDFIFLQSDGRWRRIATADRAGDRCVYEPGRDDALYVGGVGRLYRLAQSPPVIDREIEVTAKLLNMIRLDEAHRRIFAAQDNGRYVVRIGLDDPADIAYSPPLPAGRYLFDVAYDPTTDRFYSMVLGVGRLWLLEGDAATMQYRRQVELNDCYGFFLEIDPAGRQLFFTSFFTGELLIFDPDSLAIVHREKLGLTVRDLAWDAKRRLLYVVNYYAGELLAYDPQARQVKRRYDVGPIARHPIFDPAGDELLIRSNVGIFALDLALATAKTWRQETPMAAPWYIQKEMRLVRFLLPLLIRLENNYKDLLSPPVSRQPE
ncbi:MAG TPA: hypothetical protein PKW95_05940 [bacterium]|nr:hypothetical protein [bacterium]